MAAQFGEPEAWGADRMPVSAKRPRWEPKTVLVNERGEVLWRDWLGHQCADADARTRLRSLRSQAAHLHVVEAQS